MKKYFFSPIIAGLTFFSSLGQTTAKEWYNKGLDYKKKEQYKDAINAFKKAASLQVNYAESLHQLGWCYNEELMYNEAIDALTKEQKAGPPDKATNSFEMGYAYKGLKKYDDALPYFNKALDLDASYALAYKERGNTYYNKKDYKKALADYNKYEAIATNITDAGYYYNKGWCENDQEKYSEAIKSLKKCVELDDKYTNGFSELGYAYYKLNLNDEAIANYRFSMMLNNETDYHPILGIANVYYDNLKNYDSAMAYYEKGLLLTKTNKSAYYRLGWCYNEKQEFAKAINPLKEAVLLDAEYDEARTELGYAYYKLDQYDDALAQFRPIMNHDSKNELSRYYAGFCYYLKNDQVNLKRMIDELTALNSTKYVETLTKYVK
jgi:tetratricopeptide (TPR) repeat protein